MRMHGRRYAAGLLALSLTLAACGGDDDTDEETTPEPVVEETDDGEEEGEPVEEEEEPEPKEEPEEPEPDEEPTDDGEAAPSGDVTAPGSTLAFGEPAIVDLDHDDGAAQLEVTIEGVEVGSLDDLEEAGFEVDSSMQGQVPHYVSFSATNLADFSLGFASISTNVMLLLEDGARANVMTLIGSFEPCGGDSAFQDEGPGEEISYCRVFMVPDGVEASTVQYADFDQPTSDDPILWQ